METQTKSTTHFPFTLMWLRQVFLSPQDNKLRFSFGAKQILIEKFV